MSRWWRAYDEAVDDPKLQRMPGELFKSWFNLLCISSRNGGFLPSTDDIAFTLRKSPQQVETLIETLQQRGLLDDVDGRMTPHNWNARQFKSDDVSTARVKRFRERKRERERNVSLPTSETPPEQRQSRAETETEKITASAVLLTQRNGGPYAFEAGVIRLNQRDFDAWKDAFSHLDLKAELIALASWAAEQPPSKWFNAVSGALAKRNREMGLRAKTAALPTAKPDFFNDPLDGLRF